MKKVTFLAVIALLAIVVQVNAAETTVWFDDFGTYVSGTDIGGQGGWVDISDVPDSNGISTVQTDETHIYRGAHGVKMVTTSADGAHKGGVERRLSNLAAGESITTATITIVYNYNNIGDTKHYLDDSWIIVTNGAGMSDIDHPDNPEDRIAAIRLNRGYEEMYFGVGAWDDPDGQCWAQAIPDTIGTDLGNGNGVVLNVIDNDNGGSPGWTEFIIKFDFETDTVTYNVDGWGVVRTQTFAPGTLKSEAGLGVLRIFNNASEAGTTESGFDEVLFEAEMAPSTNIWKDGFEGYTFSTSLHNQGSWSINASSWSPGCFPELTIDPNGHGEPSIHVFRGDKGVKMVNEANQAASCIADKSLDAGLTGGETLLTAHVRVSYNFNNLDGHKGWADDSRIEIRSAVDPNLPDDPDNNWIVAAIRLCAGYEYMYFGVGPWQNPDGAYWAQAIPGSGLGDELDEGFGPCLNVGVYPGGSPGWTTFDIKFDFLTDTVTYDVDGWGVVRTQTFPAGTLRAGKGLGIVRINNKLSQFGLTESGFDEVSFAAEIYCPEADITGDCEVDMEDFALLASQWLQ